MNLHNLFESDNSKRKQNALWAQITDYEKRAKATSNDIKKQHLMQMVDKLRGQLKTSDNIEEGDVVQFPKKHKGDLDSVQDCPKCGGDLQGGTYMGHKVKVCIPCSQVYLPPNSGIDQKGNKIKEQSVAEGKEDKIKQLKQDYDTAVHWSKNDTNPHKREAARQKAEKIKTHLEKQYKQGVSEMDGDGAGRDGSNRKRIGSYGTRDRDIPGPDVHLGPEHALTRKQATKKMGDVLDKEFEKSHKKGVSEVSDTTLKNYKRTSAGDVINRQNIANRTGKADPKIAKRNAGQERAEKKLQGVAEAGANTKSFRAGYGKRKETKPLSPEEQIEKDRIKFEKWKTKNQKPVKGVAEGLNEFAIGDGDGDRYVPPNFGKPYKSRYLRNNQFDIWCETTPDTPGKDIQLKVTVDKSGLEWDGRSWYIDSPGGVHIKWKYGEIPLPGALDQAGNPGHIHDLISDFLNKNRLGDLQDVAKYYGFTDGEMNMDSLDEKSVSQAQFRTMAAAAHNPKFAKKVGISGKVAREFHKADRKQDYKDLPARVDETHCNMTNENELCPIHGLAECGMMIREAVSSLELAQALFTGLEQKYPDVVRNFGHEVVGDAVMDAAEDSSQVRSMSDIDMIIDDIYSQLAGANDDEFSSDFGADDDMYEGDEEANETMMVATPSVNINEARMYYNVVGTSTTDLRSDFGMRKDQKGWFLTAKSGSKRIMEAQRAFGTPKVEGYDLAGFSGSTQVKGPDNEISPIGTVPKGQIKKAKKNG